MPTKSPAQKRLMLAAAHTLGGFGGVPQSVGEKFVKADQAAGRLKHKPKQSRQKRSSGLLNAAIDGAMEKHGKHLR